VPIRPENKARYPADWKQISEAIREKAGQRCEWCGKPNRKVVTCAPGGRWLDLDAGYWRDRFGSYIPLKNRPKLSEQRPVRIVLTTAHLNHTPEDCRPETLRALCQACHLRYDAPHKARQRLERKQYSQTSLALDEV